MASSSSSSQQKWIPGDIEQEKLAREKLGIWPLDEANADLLNQVHPIEYVSSQTPHEIYDLIAIGAGAGGLVSSKQSARRGAKSAMISEHLAGGDWYVVFVLSRLYPLYMQHKVLTDTFDY